METLATLANMKRFQERRDVFAFSPFTGEEYSATPGDYFLMQDGEVLEDADGNPMYLGTRKTCIQDVVS